MKKFCWIWIVITLIMVAIAANNIGTKVADKFVEGAWDYQTKTPQTLAYTIDEADLRLYLPQKVSVETIDRSGSWDKERFAKNTAQFKGAQDGLSGFEAEWERIWSKNRNLDFDHWPAEDKRKAKKLYGEILNAIAVWQHRAEIYEKEVKKTPPEIFRNYELPHKLPGLMSEVVISKQ